MLVLYIIIFIIALSIILWQGSLIYAQFLGAPSVNSNKEAILDALSLSDLKKGQRIVDLGCGNGMVLILAAKNFGAQGVGIEKSPFYYIASKINIYLSGCSKNIKIYFGDFYQIEDDLKKADLVYLYLFDSVLEQIETKLFSTIKSGAKIVSLAFEFKNHKPFKTGETYNLRKNTSIRLYQN